MEVNLGSKRTYLDTFVRYYLQLLLVLEGRVAGFPEPPLYHPHCFGPPL